MLRRNSTFYHNGEKEKFEEWVKNIEESLRKLTLTEYMIALMAWRDSTDEA